MKKFLFMILASLMVFQLHAVVIENKNLLISWDLSNKTASSYNMWFGETADATENDDEMSLETDSSNSPSELYGYKDFYLHWDILTYVPVSISISGEQLGNGTAFIDWLGSWSSDDAKGTGTVEDGSLGVDSDGQGTYGSTKIVAYEPSSTAGLTAKGCAKISLKTVNVVDKVPASYSATLTATMTTP